MKRIIALVLMTLMVSSVAIADEILFRDIPWGSTLEEVNSAIWDVYGKEIDTSWFFTEENADILPFKQTIKTIDSGDISNCTSYKNSGYSINCHFYPYDSKHLFIAGLPVTRIVFDFIFAVEDGIVNDDINKSELVTATYRFDTDGEEYVELIDKLTWLYGEPVLKSFEGKEGILKDVGWVDYCVAWKGDNGTAVVIEGKHYTKGRGKGESDDLEVRYGKIDLDERIEFISKYWIDQERNRKYNASNTDGL